MNGYSLSLFDNLTEPSTGRHGDGPLQRLTLEELKDVVARDLEALLNTRCVIPDDIFHAWPECSQSILAYGISDFAGLCLASNDDRAKICRSIEFGIARNEPRLKNVHAVFEEKQGSVNKLHFLISAFLLLASTNEPISFDAVLQTSTLKYSINRARRSAHR